MRPEAFEWSRVIAAVPSDRIVSYRRRRAVPCPAGHVRPYLKACSVRAQLGRSDREIADGGRCPSWAGRLTTLMISVRVKRAVTSVRSGGWLKRPRRVESGSAAACAVRARSRCRCPRRDLPARSGIGRSGHRQRDRVPPVPVLCATAAPGGRHRRVRLRLRYCQRRQQDRWYIRSPRGGDQRRVSPARVHTMVRGAVRPVRGADGRPVVEQGPARGERSRVAAAAVRVPGFVAYGRRGCRPDLRHSRDRYSGEPGPRKPGTGSCGPYVCPGPATVWSPSQNPINDKRENRSGTFLQW